MAIAQACVGTTATQCAKPTLIPSDATHATTSVTVRITTKTGGAYLRYTLDGSTPTGGLSGNGTQIAAASGKVSFRVGPREKTLKAIAYKPGWPIRRLQKELTSTSRRIETNRKQPLCEMLMRQQI
jgi:hypothetical protein